MILEDAAPTAELVLVDLPAGESPLEDPKRVHTPRDRPVVVSAVAPPGARGPPASPPRAVPLVVVVCVVAVNILMVMVMVMVIVMVVVVVVVGPLSGVASRVAMTSVTTT